MVNPRLNGTGMVTILQVRIYREVWSWCAALAQTTIGIIWAVGLFLFLFCSITNIFIFTFRFFDLTTATSTCQPPTTTTLTQHHHPACEPLLAGGDGGADSQQWANDNDNNAGNANAHHQCHHQQWPWPTTMTNWHCCHVTTSWCQCQQHGTTAMSTTATCCHCHHVTKPNDQQPWQCSTAATSPPANANTNNMVLLPRWWRLVVLTSEFNTKIKHKPTCREALPNWGVFMVICN